LGEGLIVFDEQDVVRPGARDSADTRGGRVSTGSATIKGKGRRSVRQGKIDKKVKFARAVSI
jgi:hypothetical protein